MGKENSGGPKFLQPSAKAMPKEEGEKADMTVLRPPAAQQGMTEKAKEGVAAIHSMQAAAARAEDRLKEDEPDEGKDPEDKSTAEMAAMVKALQQFQTVDLIKTDEQKKLIEEKLKDHPIRIAQILSDGEFTQRVPIIEGSLVVEYRSITPEEDLMLKAMMSKEDENMSVRYLNDKYAVLNTICQTKSINGNPLPVHFTSKGWNEESFVEKRDIIMRLPVQMVWALMVHGTWFDERCRKLFVIEDIKNG